MDSGSGGSLESHTSFQIGNCRHQIGRAFGGDNRPLKARRFDFFLSDFKWIRPASVTCASSRLRPRISLRRRGPRSEKNWKDDGLTKMSSYKIVMAKSSEALKVPMFSYRDLRLLHTDKSLSLSLAFVDLVRIRSSVCNDSLRKLGEQ